MEKLTAEQALEFCRQQLQLIVSHSSEDKTKAIAQSCLEALSPEHIDGSMERDALRYQLLSSALIMSDNRPFIAYNIYEQGKFVKTKGIMGDECNAMIDPIIDRDLASEEDNNSIELN